MGDARSGALGWAVERALATAGVDPEPGTSTYAGARHDAGGELQVTLLDDGVSVASGGRTSLRVSIRNQAASEIRGEAQILSPLETWPSIMPWTQGFAVDPGGEKIVAFDVAPPPGVVAGTYWALVKIMYFGRRYYSESVPVAILAPAAVPLAGRAARR
jgi:hypothetical protein